MRRMDLLPVTRTVMALTVLGTAAIATAASAQAAAGQPAQTSSSGTGDTAGQQETTVEGPQDIQAGQSVAAPTRSSAGTGPSFEFGVEPRYISNYFEAQDEFNSSAPVTPAKSVGIITVSGSLDYNFVQNANSKITGGVRVRQNFFTNLSHADSTDFDANLVYSGQSDQLSLAYFGTRHRLVGVVNGENIYDATNGFETEYFHTFAKRLRARVRYRFAHEGYSDFKDRNLSEDEFSGDLRYKISPYFMPSVGYDYMHADGRSNVFSYDRYAPFVSVTSEIGKLAYLNFRYRHLDRHYTTDVPTDSHFGRRDHRDQLTFYGTVWLGHGFSVFGYADHIDNRSNVTYANFKTTEAGLGLFFKFD